MTARPMTLMTDDEVARFCRDPRAGFGALETERGALPLVALEVDARVAGVIAAVEVVQTFVNTMRAPIEATYVFPLPDRAAVHRFRMEVGARVIEGVVEERGAAREQYDEAIAAGHRAAIAEEDRAGVFTLRVGNLMPGESATVRLSLVGPLPVDDGQVTFQFPLVVAPRYIPGVALEGDQAGLGSAADTDQVPDASRISPPVLLPGYPSPVRLGIRVALADSGVRDVASSLHAITTTRRDAQVIELEMRDRLDRDFILRWRIDGQALRSSLVCADDADGHGGSFLLTLVPPSTTTLGGRPRDVVFVLDRSGSMDGWKMVAARRATARMVDSLTSRDRFSVLAFDNLLESLPQFGLVDATDRNRYRAVEALAKLDARGGTEMMEPLRHAADMLAGGHDDRERVIVLVTDGQVGNEDPILRELAPSLRKIRMFTLGVDRAVNAAFLRRLAAAGGGLCELVESEDRLDAVMSKVHRRIGAPVATELSVRAVGLEIDQAEISPSKLPDVYAGAPVSILGRYRKRAAAGAAIEIAGTTLGEPMKLVVVRDPELATGVALLASWARARIRDLEDRYATGARGSLERDIVALSKRHGVLSRFTAFIAIYRSAVANPVGRPRLVRKPGDQPSGWSMPSQPLLAGPIAGAATVMPRTRGMVPPGGMPVMQSMAARVSGALSEGASPRLSEESSDSARSAAVRPPPAPAQAPAPFVPLVPAPAPQTPSFWKSAKREAAESSDGASAYLHTLRLLAEELEAQARGRADAMAIRVLRQRLTEWVEDVRSVGGPAGLADAVERLVQRLSQALLANAGLPGSVLGIAGELLSLAKGTPPPAPPKKSRLAFWK
ncbi:MAG: VIT domain-containing protein [Kofleriaceae bacterium]